MPCHRVTLSLRAVSIYLRHSKVWFLKRLFISHDHNIWSCDCCQGALATSRLHLLKLQQYSTKVRALMYADKQRLFCCVALLWPSQALCRNQSEFSGPSHGAFRSAFGVGVEYLICWTYGPQKLSSPVLHCYQWCHKHMGYGLILCSWYRMYNDFYD